MLLLTTSGSAHSGLTCVLHGVKTDMLHTYRLMYSVRTVRSGRPRIPRNALV